MVSTIVIPTMDRVISNRSRVSEVLQQVHSQFVSHPEENLCCFNHLDVKVSKLYQDWDRLGSLRGLDHDNSFTSLVRDVTTKKQELVSDEMKDEVVPPELMSLMGVYKDIFIRVNDVCYSSITLKLKELIPDDSVQKERNHIFQAAAVAVAAKTTPTANNEDPPNVGAQQRKMRMTVERRYSSKLI